MRDIIQRHNRLNGLVFSIAEFVLIALLVGAFAAYYLIHQRWLMAFIGWGIALNCVPVVVFGCRQLAQARATGLPTPSFYTDKRAREQHRRENPHVLRDTLTFAVAALLPFLMLAAVLFDLRRRERI